MDNNILSNNFNYDISDIVFPKERKSMNQKWDKDNGLPALYNPKYWSND